MSFDYELRKYLNDNFKIYKFVHVNDYWAPNYSGNKVKVGMSLIPSLDGGFYVTQNAWGNDDTGVERFYHGSYEECLKVYNEWKALYDNIPEVVNKKWFLERGFVYA